MVFKVKQWEHFRRCWHLTPREVEVAKLICEGLNNIQICKKLKISYNTVRAHMGNIFRKVGVNGKAQMILQLVEVQSKSGI